MIPTIEKSLAGNPLDPRDQGRRAVFSTVRERERIARVDIARRTGISQATVTGLTAELIQAGLVEEVNRDRAVDGVRRGRPRVDLCVRGSAHLIAGIKIAPRVATVAILDFAGVLVGQKALPLPSPIMNPGQIADFVRHALQEATAPLGLSPEDLSAVGIGLPGIIDAPRGFVYWSPVLNARNVSLLDDLGTALSMNVFIDNDANLFAIAEQWRGCGRDVRDFIVVTIEHGVGMGIVIDNRLYRGAHGCGAELGHTKVALDGALCRCGQRGCLEAYVADYALLRETNATMDLPPSASEEERLFELFRRAKAGDLTAESIFDRAGQMLAMGLANIVNIFDPSLIILSGERMHFDYLYADKVIDSFRNSVIQVDSPPPEIRIQISSDLMWAQGAATYAIEAVTESALNQLGAPAR